MKAAIPPKGNEHPDGIFRAVGFALTLWESFEDIQFDCFVAVCGPHEPTSVETYIHAPRGARLAMIQSACQRYSAELPVGIGQRLVTLTKAGDKLATRRNEIAHGRCEKQHSIVDGVVVLDGHYLMPSKGYPWLAGAPTYRYAYVESSIMAFCQEVRKLRSDLLDAYFELIQSEWYKSMMSDPKIVNRLFSA